MKRNIILIGLLAALLLACADHRKVGVSVLWENLRVPEENDPSWEQLLTNKYKVTPLETNDSCLVGPIEKIRKFQGHYYILTLGKILHFDRRGKCVSVLERKGMGPEEYNRVEDFDVYEIEGRTEIWVSDNQSLKAYDAFDGSFLSRMSFPFVIHKFKRLENTCVLLVTGQGERSLTLVDKTGQIVSEFLEKEIPFLMFRPVQFVKYDQRYLFQLGIANAFVSLDPQTNVFAKGCYTSDKKYLSDQELLALFAEKGMEFIRFANQRCYISNWVALNEKAWVHTCLAGENYLSKIRSGTAIVSTKFQYGDILSTLFTGESDDSLLLYVLPEQQEECNQSLALKDKDKLTMDAFDNPCLLEFF